MKNNLLLSLPTHLAVRNLFTFLSISECFQVSATCKQMYESIQITLEFYSTTFQASKLNEEDHKPRMLLCKMKSLCKLRLDRVSSFILGDCAQRIGSRLLVLECTNTVVTDAVLFEIARTCAMLQTLKLSSDHEHSGSISITQWGILALAGAPCAKTLRTVSITGCANLTDFGSLVEACPQLECLALSHCLGIKTVSSAAAIVVASLNQLDLSFNADLQILAPFIPYSHLKEINLSGCVLINDAALIWIAQSSPQLVDISVSYCTKITDHGLKRFFSLLLHVERFACARCMLVGDVGLMPISSKALRILDCQHCHRVTNLLLEHLATTSPNLEALYLRGTSKIDDTGVEQLCAMCTKLQCLSLAACNNVTNASLFAVASHLHQLKTLDLFCLCLVTDEGVQEIADRCVRLQNLTVSWCFHLTPDLVHELKHTKRFPVAFLHEGLDTLALKLTSSPRQFAANTHHHRSPSMRRQRERQMVPLDQVGFFSPLSAMSLLTSDEEEDEDTMQDFVLDA